jgi:hypothetical protein
MNKLKKYPKQVTYPFDISTETDMKDPENMTIWTNYQKNLDTEWRIWIDENDSFFRNIKFPETALIGRLYFIDFIYNYWDKYSGEQFSVEDLCQEDAIRLLVLLDTFVEEPLNCSLYCDLRRFCGYDYEFGCMPSLPVEIINLYLECPYSESERTIT